MTQVAASAKNAASASAAITPKCASSARTSRLVVSLKAVARAVSDLARDDAIFVFDTGLNTLWSANWLRQTGRQRIIGSFNNGAVGTALGQGNGVQALDRSKQVIVFTGDGGFNMLMGEFLTATHHGLPVKVVDYRVRSVTQDMDALGEAQVEIEHRGRRSRARAVSVDVVEASALAYLEVINRVASRQLRDRLKPTDHLPPEAVPVV